MPFADGYSKSIGRGQAEDEPPQQEDAVAVQVKVDWMQASMTKRMMRELIEQSDALVGDATAAALVNHQTPNEKLIVSKLIQADVLRKVVDKYAKIK